MMKFKSTTPLLALLRKSPFKPLQEHMGIVFSCISYIPPLIDAIYRKELTEANEFAHTIIQLESEADRIKHHFRFNMPTTLLLPVNRKDLLCLMSEQDRMADISEDVAKIFLYRSMVAPDVLKESLGILLQGTMEISAAAKSIIEELDELLQVGFQGREQKKVSKMISGVRRNEHNLDSVIHRTRCVLAASEHQFDPVTVIFWYQIIDLIGRISDQAENVADHLLLFLSK